MGSRAGLDGLQSRSGWAPEAVCTGAEILDPTAIRPRIVQPVASRSDDCAVVTHICCYETKAKYRIHTPVFLSF